MKIRSLLPGFITGVLISLIVTFINHWFVLPTWIFFLLAILIGLVVGVASVYIRQWFDRKKDGQEK